MKKTILLIVLILSAMVIGGLIGESFYDSGSLAFLAYYKEFQFQFDLVSINLACGIKAYVAQLLLIFAALFAYTKLAPKIDKA